MSDRGFRCPGDSREKFKESKKLDIVRDLRKLRNMKVTVVQNVEKDPNMAVGNL